MFAISHFQGIPWVVCQAAFLAEAHWTNRKSVVNGYLLCVSMLTLAYTVYNTISFFNVHSHLVCEGSWTAFLEFLLRLGRGTGVVPIAAMEILMTNRDVIVAEDLSYLDYRGIRSIGSAIKSSMTLRSVTFQNCNFEDAPGFNEDTWKEFTDYFCLNRYHLRMISFEPAVKVEEDKWWYCSDARDLDFVKNGEDFIFSASANRLHPLEIAVRANDFNAVLDELRRAQHADLPDTSSQPLNSWDDEQRLGDMKDDFAILAARLDNWSAMSAFLAVSEGADNIVTLDKESLLIQAASEGSECVVELLFQQNADPLARRDVGDWRGDVLAGAAAAPTKSDKVISIMQMALNLRADPNSEGSYGAAALHWAANRDNAAAARFLIDAGAQIDKADEESGSSPLHWCCVDGSPNVAELLLQARADPELRTCDDETPLMLTAKNTAARSAVALIKSRADIQAKTNRDPSYTALMFAEESGHDEVKDLLLDAIAGGR